MRRDGFIFGSFFHSRDVRRELPQAPNDADDIHGLVLLASLLLGLAFFFTLSKMEDFDIVHFPPHFRHMVYK